MKLALKTNTVGEAGCWLRWAISFRPSLASVQDEIPVRVWYLSSKGSFHCTTRIRKKQRKKKKSLQNLQWIFMSPYSLFYDLTMYNFHRGNLKSTTELGLYIFRRQDYWGKYLLINTFHVEQQSSLLSKEEQQALSVHLQERKRLIIFRCFRKFSCYMSRYDFISLAHPSMQIRNWLHQTWHSRTAPLLAFLILCLSGPCCSIPLSSHHIHRG